MSTQDTSYDELKFQHVKRVPNEFRNFIISLNGNFYPVDINGEELDIKLFEDLTSAKQLKSSLNLFNENLLEEIEKKNQRLQIADKKLRDRLRVEYDNGYQLQEQPLDFDYHTLYKPQDNFGYGYDTTNTTNTIKKKGYLFGGRRKMNKKNIKTRTRNQRTRQNKKFFIHKRSIRN